MQKRLYTLRMIFAAMLAATCGYLMGQFDFSVWYRTGSSLLVFALLSGTIFTPVLNFAMMLYQQHKMFLGLVALSCLAVVFSILPMFRGYEQVQKTLEIAKEIAAKLEQKQKETQEEIDRESSKQNELQNSIKAVEEKVNHLASTSSIDDAAILEVKKAVEDAIESQKKQKISNEALYKENLELTQNLRERRELLRKLQDTLELKKTQLSELQKIIGGLTSPTTTSPTGGGNPGPTNPTSPQQSGDKSLLSLLIGLGLNPIVAAVLSEILGDDEKIVQIVEDACKNASEGKPVDLDSFLSNFPVTKGKIAALQALKEKTQDNNFKGEINNKLAELEPEYSNGLSGSEKALHDYLKGNPSADIEAIKTSAGLVNGNFKNSEHKDSILAMLFILHRDIYQRFKKDLDEIPINEQ